MAATTQPAGSDLEMMSQTETEDTDSGEVSSENTSQSTNTSETSDSTLDSTSSEDPVSASAGEQGVTKPVNVSVDLTDVTELEDNALGSGDNLSNDIHLRRDSCKEEAKDKKLRSTEKEGLANLDFSRDWYNQDCFRTYWRHYDEVMSWCRQHIQVYQNSVRKSTAKASASSSHRPPLFDPRSQGYQSNSMYPPSLYHPYTYQQQNIYRNMDLRRNGVKKANRRRRKSKHRNPKSTSSSEVTSSETQTETSEEFQMEITQDMIDFFAKTQAHRKQRDEARKAEQDEEDKEPEHINVEDVKVTEMRKRTAEAPKERPGARRTAEMKLLYGQGAAMIHGMETALQMAYDRNTDLKQPKLWPNMPLRVVFG